MLTYKTLYRRIRESTGMDVLTTGAIQTIIENCLADLTSRGHRNFEEKVCYLYREKDENETQEQYDELRKWMYEPLGYGLYKLPLPENCRRILYLKLASTYRMYNGLRLSITDDRINNVTVDMGKMRTAFTNLEWNVIYYTNGDDIFIETRDREMKLTDLRLGYDKKIIVPEEPKLKEFENTVIDIRQEFEDALVLYGIYFIYNRYSKEVERIQMALNNYKYYVEDITATLSHEDDYTRPQGVRLEERV